MAECRGGHAGGLADWDELGGWQAGHLVKQQAAASALGRHREDPAVADERPQLLGRGGEEAVSVMAHQKPV